MTVREPWGLVLCLLPFNSPIALFAQKAIPALLMGNSVIVKPASDTPLCNILMTDQLLRSGVDANAVQIITGRGSQVGKHMVCTKDIDVVSLTGSTEVGISPSPQPSSHGEEALLCVKDYSGVGASSGISPAERMSLHTAAGMSC
jgi:succinate-semialdehyde dehydrogenase/glutarate-semialdehyde dehydrogenase